MYINLDDGMIWSKKLKVSAGDKNSDNFLGLYTSYSTQEYWTDEGTSIAGSGNLTTWRIIAGKNFGVTRSGALYASSAHVTGTITANSGTIGKWTITTGGNLQSVNNSVVLNGTSGNITGARVYANVLKAGGNGNSDGSYILTADGSSVNITGATIKGNNNGGTYAYQLTSAGKLTATSAELTTLTVKGALTVTDSAKAKIEGPLGINMDPSSTYDLSVDGKSYLNGNIGIGCVPSTEQLNKSDVSLTVAGAAWVKADLHMSGNIYSKSGPRNYISFEGTANGSTSGGVWLYGEITSLFATTVQLGIDDKTTTNVYGNMSFLNTGAKVTLTKPENVEVYYDNKYVTLPAYIKAAAGKLFNFSLFGDDKDIAVAGGAFKLVNSNNLTTLEAPTSQGTNGQILKTTGSGETEWSSISLSHNHGSHSHTIYYKTATINGVTVITDLGWSSGCSSASTGSTSVSY